MSEKSLDLSLIIPCYNEKDILIDNVEKIKEFLDKTLLKYEIILVDDYSKDNTVELAEKIVSEGSDVRLIKHEVNMGRGKAVEDGLKAACGRVAGFLDIDLQIPAHYILPIFLEIEKGADIATAQRVYDVKFHMLHRFILSKGYHKLFDMLLKTGIKDSETGYKFFRRERILPILEEIRDKRWFWDTEIMVRSCLKDYVIKELPCLCIREEAQKSTVKIFKDTLYYFVNLWRFKKEIDRIRCKERKIKK